MMNDHQGDVFAHLQWQQHHNCTQLIISLQLYIEICQTVGNDVKAYSLVNMYIYIHTVADHSEERH